MIRFTSRHRDAGISAPSWLAWLSLLEPCCWAFSGYGGQPIVVIEPTEPVGIRALSLVGADHERAPTGLEMARASFERIVNRQPASGIALWVRRKAGPSRLTRLLIAANRLYTL